MKQKYMINIIIISTWLVSCSNVKTDFQSAPEKESLINKVNSQLNLNIEASKIEQIQYQKFLVDDAYNYPYTVYIKIKGDTNLTSKVISSLQLKREPKELLSKCDDFFINFFGSNYWKINTYNQRYTSSFVEKELSLSWWNPDTLNVHNNFYGFTNDTINSIPITCNEDWNGRVVLQKTANGFYIIIDYVM